MNDQAVVGSNLRCHLNPGSLLHPVEERLGRLPECAYGGRVHRVGSQETQLSLRLLFWCDEFEVLGLYQLCAKCLARMRLVADEDASAQLREHRPDGDEVVTGGGALG